MTIRMYKLYSGAGGEISLTAVEGSMESNEKLGQKGWGQLMKERVGGREGITITIMKAQLNTCARCFSTIFSLSPSKRPTRWYSLVFKSLDSGIRVPGFKFQLCQSLDVQFWESYLISLCLLPPYQQNEYNNSSYLTGLI